MKDKPSRIKKTIDHYRTWSKIEIGKLIKVCLGKRHAWFETKIGPVRKPIQITS